MFPLQQKMFSLRRNKKGRPKGRQGPEDAIVAIDYFTLLHRELIATPAAQHGLPAVHGGGHAIHAVTLHVP